MMMTLIYLVARGLMGLNDVSKVTLVLSTSAVSSVFSSGLLTPKTLQYYSTLSNLLTEYFLTFTSVGFTFESFLINVLSYFPSLHLVQRSRPFVLKSISNASKEVCVFVCVHVHACVCGSVC